MVTMTAQAPPGWHVRVTTRPRVAAGSTDSRTGMRADGAGDVTRPVLHAASLSLPTGLADFGGELIDALGPDDAFVALIDHGPEVAGAGLFARNGRPTIAPSQFATNRLARYVPGRSAGQWFFTEGGHGFCLYAVTGAHSRRMSIVPTIARVVSSIRVGASGTIGGVG